MANNPNQGGQQRQRPNQTPYQQDQNPIRNPGQQTQNPGQGRKAKQNRKTGPVRRADFLTRRLDGPITYRRF